MSSMPEQYRCRHIRTTGHQCGSPALREENFCFYHNTNRPPTRRKTLSPAGQPEPELLAPFILPLLEDRAAVQVALGQVVGRIAARQIDPKEAALLLYALQIASSNLPPHPKSASTSESGEQAEPLYEVVADTELGTVAPAGKTLDSLRHHDTISRNLVLAERSLRRRAEEELANAYAAHPELAPPPPPVRPVRGIYQGGVFIPSADPFYEKTPPPPTPAP